MKIKTNQPKIQIVHIALLIAFVLGGRSVFQYLFDKTVYRGPWYQVTVPVGWSKTVKDDEVIFSSPEKDLFTEIPDATFSVYAKKSTGALFIEDVITEVLEALPKVNAELIDKGEFKIAGVISKWVLFYQKETNLTVLTFYFVDDFNRLTKIELVTTTRRFTQYQPEFEKFKSSFKFLGMI